MALTLPTVVPTNYAGTVADFRIAKEDRSGAVRREYFTVTVPIATATSTYVGLVPVRKGARVSFAGLYIADIGDGSFTNDIGFLAYDSTIGTTDDDAFASAITTGRTGGLITLDEHAWIDFKADGDGWIVVKTAGSATDAAGVIKGHVMVSYDN